MPDLALHRIATPGQRIGFNHSFSTFFGRDEKMLELALDHRKKWTDVEKFFGFHISRFCGHWRKRAVFSLKKARCEIDQLSRLFRRCVFRCASSKRGVNVQCFLMCIESSIAHKMDWKMRQK